MENGNGDSTHATRRPPPVREDCWSEEATDTLVEAWGKRFLEVNRGHLRQHHWKEVADAVNSRHGHVSKHRRTDVQCKNRMDTLKKKYKAEKARVDGSASQDDQVPTFDGGVYSSPWHLFSHLDYLIGPSYKTSPSPVPARRRRFPTMSTVPVKPRSKRPVMAEDSSIQQNFSPVVAFGDDDSDGEESESGKSRTSWGGLESSQLGGGFGEVVEAIERLGEVYKRVEGERQRQMVELEKHRMKFAKDLEIQRMKMFMESQIQMEKLRQVSRNKNKRARQEDGDDGEGILSSFCCIFNV